jgi:hypothetical protein
VQIKFFKILAPYVHSYWWACLQKLYHLHFFLDNPLDCTCQLADFQSWLKTSAKLDRTSRNEATCATPPSLSNANLFNVTDLACTDDDDGADSIFDIASLDLPPAVSLQKQVGESGAAVDLGSILRNSISSEKKFG